MAVLRFDVVCQRALLFRMCSVCGKTFSLTKAGFIRKHNICRGAHLPPAEQLLSELSVVRVCT